MRLFSHRVMAVGVAALALGGSITALAVTPSTGIADRAGADASKPAATSETGAPEANVRLREGTKLVDQTGFFKLTGDGLNFVTTDGKKHFGGLPNLALERVARVVGDSPDSLEWIVSGQVTEYRESNYLLLTTAMIKAKTTAAH